MVRTYIKMCYTDQRLSALRGKNAPTQLELFKNLHGGMSILSFRSSMIGQTLSNVFRVFSSYPTVLNAVKLDFDRKIPKSPKPPC